MPYRECTFHEQAECIAPKVISFDYDQCIKVSFTVTVCFVDLHQTPNGPRCLPECNSVRHVAGIYHDLFLTSTVCIDAFQNGIYRTADVDQSLNMAIKTATMVLYMTEVDEVVYTETPEYGMEAELSILSTTNPLLS